MTIIDGALAGAVGAALFLVGRQVRLVGLGSLFALRGSLPKPVVLAVQVATALLALAAWWLISTKLALVKPGILPPPERVFGAFGELLAQNNLVSHIGVSVKLNLLGYLVACLVSLPLGFLLGLYPVFEAMSERLLSALRFLPLPAAMGVFIAAFGISTLMKVMFLAVGIIVYLLPTVVTRVRETAIEHVQAARTLGATDWQLIRKVFVPSVLSRVWDDIRVLTAISWTYVTIAEVVNAGEGGLGALANNSWRSGRMDKVYTILVVIIVLGWLQDLLFKHGPGVAESLFGRRPRFSLFQGRKAAHI